MLSSTIPIGATEPIGAIGAASMRLIGAIWPLPLQHDAPSDDFKNGGDASESSDDADVSVLPFFLRVQNVKSLEDVDHTEDYDSVANAVVVYVPV